MRSTLLFAGFFLIALPFIQCRKDKDALKAIPAKSVIRGRVLNEYNQLLLNAKISLLVNNTRKEVTADFGFYQFNELEAGDYAVTAALTNYIESSKSVKLNTNDTVEVDFVLKAGSATLKLLSDSLIQAPPREELYLVSVSSNTQWTISSNAPWLKLSRNTGSANDTFYLRVPASTEDTLRSASITVQAGSLYQNIQIRQRPPIKLLKTEVLPGNLAIGVVDSVRITFNQPVIFKSLVAEYELCVSDKKMNSRGNTYTFSYGCGKLGWEFPFRAALNNAFGDTTTVRFNAKFYERVFEISSNDKLLHCIDDKTQTFWVASQSLKKLYKFNTHTLEKLLEISLPKGPVVINYNPYNKHIYVGFELDTNLYEYNTDGTLLRTIALPDNVFDKDLPVKDRRRFPVMLNFTNNGIGLLWLSVYTLYSYSSICIIDAANDHRITVPAQSGYFIDAQLNHDGKKLLLTPGNDLSEIGIFDGESQKFSRYLPTKRTRGVYITASRINSYVYSGQLYNQLIVDPFTGFESSESAKSVQGYADFAYLPGRELTVYNYAEGYIEVMDYNRRSSPVFYDTINFGSITTTTDGQFVLLTWRNGNGSARVVQLPGKWFAYE